MAFKFLKRGFLFFCRARANAESVSTQRIAVITAFTLVELLVVFAILGALASIAIPSYGNYLETVREDKAILEIRIMEKEIKVFEGANGRFPVSLNEIGFGNSLDPWGNPYQYLDFATGDADDQRRDRNLRPINTDFDLYSMGRDGQTQTQVNARWARDDIIRGNDGRFVGLGLDF